MTDKKQIIIDGVDVSRCEHWNICKQCQLSQLPESGYKLLCKDNPNCSFKQLTRKTQECEEYKKQLELVFDSKKNERKLEIAMKALTELSKFLIPVKETDEELVFKRSEGAKMAKQALNIINKEKEGGDE